MEHLKLKPFALVGVNVNSHTPETLRAVMTREKLPWRSFADRGDIVSEWNWPATPTYFVLDHRGVIRHKWTGDPGEACLDSALENLLAEAEADREKK